MPDGLDREARLPYGDDMSTRTASTATTPIAWAIESLVHFGLVGSFDSLADAQAALDGMIAVAPTVPVAAAIIGLTADGERVSAR